MLQPRPRRRPAPARHLLAATVVGVFVLLTVPVASATPTAPAEPATSATVTITGGSLGITAPSAADNLGTRADSGGGGIIAGRLGEVQVNAAPGVIVKVGTATCTGNNPPDLTGVAPVVTAAGMTGDSSATWNPTITVAVPGGMATGFHSASIRHPVV